MASTALIILSFLAWCYACVEYARCSWYTNSDVMGASLSFTCLWLLGVALFSCGLMSLHLLPLWAVLLVTFGLVATGKVVEWFVIERLLHRLFKNYRQRGQ